MESNEELGYTGFSDGHVNGGFPHLRHGFEPVRDVLEPGDVLCYVEVEDLEATLAQAVELGGEVLLEKTEAAPGDHLGIFRDPAGVKFAVSSCDRNYGRWRRGSTDRRQEEPPVPHHPGGAPRTPGDRPQHRVAI